jgi:LysW-gamma-L-lysine carboxypeptidase
MAGEHGTVTFEEACPAFRSQRTTTLAKHFVRSIQTVGGKAGFVQKTGTSDMNVVGPAWGIPIIAYGPGDSRLDHTPNEHVSVEEYRRAIAVMTGVLEQIA